MFSQQTDVITSPIVRKNNKVDVLMNCVLSHYRLGNLLSEPVKISDGFTNTVYDINTSVGRFVLKIIDGTTPRARSFNDYVAVELLMKKLNNLHHIPLVLAKRIMLRPVFAYEGKCILLYPFIESKQLAGPIGPVEPGDAYKAGDILGRIHQANVQPENLMTAKFQPTLEFDYTIDLDSLATMVMNDNQLSALLDIAKTTQAAYQRLRANMVYSHGDYQPHNLLVHHAELTIIDWELGGLINPDMECIIACITFSGYATGEFNSKALEQFFFGYSNQGCRLQDNLDDVILAAIHKCWVNWIVFNLQMDNRPVASAAFQGLLSMLAKKEDLTARLVRLEKEAYVTVFKNPSFRD